MKLYIDDGKKQIKTLKIYFIGDGWNVWWDISYANYVGSSVTLQTQRYYNSRKHKK